MRLCTDVGVGETSARTRAGGGRVCSGNMSRKRKESPGGGSCCDGMTVKLRAHDRAKGHRSDRRSARSSMEHPPVPRRSWHPVVSKPTLDPPSGPPAAVRQNVSTGAARGHRARNRYQSPELLCMGHNFPAGANRRTSLLMVRPQWSWSLSGWGPFRHLQGHLTVWSEPCLDLNDVSLLDMDRTPGSPRRRGNGKGPLRAG